MRQHKRSPRQSHSSRSFLLLVMCFLLAIPAGADWLLTRENGKMIETKGPWTVQGPTVIYTDPAGEERQISTSTVNLEWSEKLTAMRAAKPIVPPRQPRAEAPKARVPMASQTPKAEAGEAKIILYRTSWCGYCNKTAALLDSLDVAFVEKDIEADSGAAAEYRQKARGYTGIPLTDINGQLVKGFKVTLIQRLVEQLKQQEAAEAEGSEAGR